MQETQHIMGMHVTLDVADKHATQETLDMVFDYFHSIDERFSTFKDTSETMQINRHEIAPSDYSEDMQEILALALLTKEETGGFFDATRPDGSLDPAGIVKGWAIQNAANLLIKHGFTNFLVDAGGDIQTHGKNASDTQWSLGIQNPRDTSQIVKVIYPRGHGIATSGTYQRGQHIYNPHAPEQTFDDIMSLTVIGPNVLEADRIATGAFAMGRDGIMFVEQLPEFEAYAIDTNGIATMTSQFEQFTQPLSL